MKIKNVWRLKDQPTTTNVLELVNANLITKEEAKDIIFTQQTEEGRDNKSLQSEIKFLRDLVDKLSNGQSNRVVQIIHEVQKPYQQWGWYQPYYTWCSTATIGNNVLTTDSTNVLLNGISNATTGIAAVSYANAQTAGNTSFSNIKTF